MNGSILDFWFIWLVIIILGVYPFIRARLMKKASLPVAWDQVEALDRDKYRVIHNFRVELHELPSRIDYLILSEAGFFIVKGINGKGRITGKENDHEWTHSTGLLKIKFPNPIRIGSLYREAVAEKLKDYPSAPLLPIMVFPDQAKLAVNAPSGKIINAHELENLLNSHSGKKLTKSDIEKIYDSLVEKSECRVSNI